MKKYNGFTLAEMLITLAIIGVVAAIVIPTVVKNYNDRKYNTARLKALHTFGDAGKMASINDEINSQANAMDFVNNVLSKYLKITKVCETASDCGFPDQIQPSDPSVDKLVSDELKSWSKLNANSYAWGNWTPTYDNNFTLYITTADGFSAKIFYNPRCARNSREISISELKHCAGKECPTWGANQACLNIVYDMNGTKEPNHAGEDIGFVTTFWSGLNSVSVAPGILPYNIAKTIYDEGGQTGSDAQILCANRGTTKISYTLPNVYELQSITINQKLSSIPNTNFWSGTPIADKAGLLWIVHGNTSRDITLQNSWRVWCVRR